MFKINFSDKGIFNSNGYLVKNLFVNDQKFLEYSHAFKSEINNIKDKNYIKKLHGFKSGNLNIHLGKFSQKFISLLINNNFSEYFNFLTGDNIENYEILTGGNLNFPGSKKQMYHTDGNWSPRMIIVNIASSDINLANGPIELLEKSHKKKLPYWKFILKRKNFNSKKIKLKLGDILIREHRLWHRGTRNNSNEFREMIGIMLLKKEKNIERKKKFSTNVELYSNMYEENVKGKIMEFIFIHFKFLIVIYMIFISLKK